MGDNGVGQEERQDPQDPVELQRDTADGDSSTAGAALSAEQVATLVRLLRVAYPHPSFPDGPYQRTAKSVQDADTDHLLAAGLSELDDLAGGHFGALSDAEATAAIERIADGAFFKLVHSTTVVALYDDREVWDLLGYEGPSYDKGGYLNRGFDDLDWLPAARITEYTDAAASRDHRPSEGLNMATIDHDESVVVIIGSGAGGGTMAHELTTKGVKCVLLEAGPHLTDDDYVNDEWPAFSQMAWLDMRTTSGSWRVSRDFPNLPTWIVKAVGWDHHPLGGGDPAVHGARVPDPQRLRRHRRRESARLADHP